MKLLKEIYRKDNLDFNGKILSREAVRGIIFKENKLLLIHSEIKNYDYKFPGGGINENETYEEALKREILEETGYKVVAVEKEFGKVVEFDIPQEKEFDIFKMTSYYYTCKVSEKNIEQKLDEYEQKLGFKAVWADIEQAIENNESLLKTGKAPRWTKRETFILKEIKEQQMKQYYAERAKEHDKVYLKPERQEDIKKIHAYLREGLSEFNVLEVACGTGYWTQTIAESALSISASDYNNEVIDIARSRDYKISDITFFEDDAYKLSKVNGAYNSGFAGFFWSHIPLNKLQEFLNCFHSKLESGAKIVFIDNAFAAGSSTPIARTDKDGNTYQNRKLENGKEFEVLKNFPSKDQLRNLLSNYSDNVKITCLQYYWIAEYKLRKI